MKLGFFGVNTGVLTDPNTMVDVAQTAEAAGWESLWTGEHVVVADPQRPPSPVGPDTHFVDQIAALSFLAAHTSAVRLCTGIVILPQRNPMVLAKELASVDVLSGGRLEAGFGVGYVPAEFKAIGIPFSERGARTDDYIDAMRALWRGDKSFHSRSTSWEGISALPQPREVGGPPVHVGGSSQASYRRAARRAHGWYGFLTTLAATEAAVRSIRRHVSEIDRPKELGEVRIAVSPAEPVDRDLVRRYEDLGVERLVLVRDYRDLAGGHQTHWSSAVLRFLEETPDQLGFD
ncbi:MAG: LLM class F420-dependent oxidoreductase [Acidimicrobiaceae bacterium]|nr:LLM class F420-dependent oxidoreductase [Acidimicrobiaceae bacterium]|tara:strand:+ start:1772 stop:2641 length:870 start_codon:yes stop_codon:yes gene_type:complete